MGIEWTARVCFVICFPHPHRHTHMLTHYLPSSTLPQASVTSPFDDVVKGAWPHALTRRWQHNGFKADVQEQWLQTHTPYTCHTHTSNVYTTELLDHILPPLGPVMWGTWKCHRMNIDAYVWMRLQQNSPFRLLYTKTLWWNKWVSLKSNHDVNTY